MLWISRTSRYKGEVLTIDQVKDSITKFDYQVALPMSDAFSFSPETESYCVSNGYLHTDKEHYATTKASTTKVIDLLKAISKLQ